MGQSLDSMRQPQQERQRSKAELLYDVVAAAGNVDTIKVLFYEGASLEWIDIDGKNPLIVACMNPNLIDCAKTLIELGANINAYRPGRHNGTPLHHAARKGLERTVALLLSQGANALVRNDDCQTPLDVARLNGHADVVRTLENHICYFSGWVREIYGPGFLGALAPHLLSRKIWVVVIPLGPNNRARLLKLELAVYSTLEDAQPSMVISLWKSRIEKPNLNQTDLTLTISDDSTKCRLKLASAIQGDKQQIPSLYAACQGTSQVMYPSVNHGTENSVAAAELATSSSNSVQSASGATPMTPNSHRTPEESNTNGWGKSASNDSHNEWGPVVRPSKANTRGWMDEQTKDDYNGWSVNDSRPLGNRTKHAQTNEESTSTGHINQSTYASVPSAPSAPPIPEEHLFEGPIHYPSIDLSTDVSTQPLDNEANSSNGKKDGGDSSSSCVICWEAPIEGACIPCGHMAGCMSCLTEIKAKKGVCPVCRSVMDQVVKIYAV
ncbi:putative E3 ubiquitin-protein ligase XBAT34 [Humulus lupulus]|uniref:putative E3 ubiquitin-protein ligase XBAT34 n=1 Tax=Humulus lupulus TaxID=3486 RepID=UPI002B40A9B1|nr:putative E3 ubiquitin-protein ligase XBAT34 [Humulus lupulus]